MFNFIQKSQIEFMFKQICIIQQYCMGDTSLSIIPPYVLHCCDDVPDDGDMAELCYA